jgi:branched-chain amino acid transport system ATP-binding protein
MLSVNNIEVIYSSVILVLRGVSFQVQTGQIVALLGPNGAGKSTTLKAISGLLKSEDGEVTRGSIEWNGQHIDGLNPEDIVQRGIIQVIEGRQLFRHLTVEENLHTGAMTYHGGRHFKADLERVYNYFPRLREMRRRVSGYISGGEGQMLVIGRALMSHPRLILLDEPSLGLAPMLVQEIFQIIREIQAQEGVSVLLGWSRTRAPLWNWPNTAT